MESDIQRLSSELHSSEAARRLYQTVKTTRFAQQDPLRETMVNAFVGAKASLAQLIPLLDHDEIAFDLFMFLAGRRASGHLPAQRRFGQLLVTSGLGPTAVQGLINVALSAAQARRIDAFMVLIGLVFQHRELARAAADSGGMSQIAGLLEDAKDDDTKILATGALANLISDSAVRAKQAFKEGLMWPLLHLLAPDAPAAAQDAAMMCIRPMVVRLDALPDDPDLVELCITRLSGAIARSTSSLDVKQAACGSLCKITHLDRHATSRAVAAALFKAAAAPSLVKLLEGSCEMMPAVMPTQLLLGMAMHEPDAATAMVAAGVITAAKRKIASADVSGRITAAQLLTLLATQSSEYAAAIGPQCLRDAKSAVGGVEQESARVQAKILAREAVCAACGGTEGAGKDGQLQQCSACHLVSYCSKECQKGHWKVHKRSCCAGVKKYGG